jgi:nuclear transcription factor Y, gamma
MENRSQNQPEEKLTELYLGFPPQPPLTLSPHQQYQLDVLWKNHKEEVEHMTDFKTHPLPVTRVRRVMKACREVEMVSSEAPIMIAKACEMFIHDLTLRAWINAQENTMSTIETINFYDAICHTDNYKFLIMPRGGRGSSSAATSGSQYPPAIETKPQVLVTDEEQSAAQGSTSNPQNYH